MTPVTGLELARLFGVDLEVVGPGELRAATAELGRRYARASGVG